VLCKLLVLPISQHIHQTIEGGTDLDERVIFYLDFALIFAVGIVTAQEGSQADTHVHYFIAVFGNVEVDFRVLASMPIGTVRNHNVLFLGLRGLDYKVTDLSTFNVKLVLSENQCAIVSPSALLFEVLGVLRSLGVHNQLSVGGVSRQPHLQAQRWVVLASNQIAGPLLG
jgi:hypothetical protein